MDHRVSADEAKGVCRRTCPHHTVDRVHHHKGTADDGEHLRGAGRQRRFVEFNIHQFALLFADPEGEHAKDAE
ncbi:hypothetical protein D9M69_521210 [compost metagenome]